MNNNIENLLYESGLTAQGCWDELDQYAQEAIIRVIQLTVKECAKVVEKEMDYNANWCDDKILKHFGVQK